MTAIDKQVPLSEKVLVGLSKKYRQSLNEAYALKLQQSYKRARGHNNRIAFIMGTPDHINLGDQAIILAESEFVSSLDANICPVYVPMPLLMRGRQNIMANLVKRDDILLGVGGGNMGDTYMEEELCRRKFIQEFPDNKIVLFPQTIHFSDNPTGKSELKKTVAIYSEHKDLTLIAREKTSYEKMLRDFPKNKVLLTPDIVLSISHSTPHLQRHGALLCLRSDLEGKLSADDKQTITELCQKYFGTITHTDTLSTSKLFALHSKKNAVINKLAEFKAAKFVITDRLHGMVFSAITGTPCVALTNYNHKVTGTYEWIKHLPYIKFCSDISELDTLLKQLDVDQPYDYDPTQYDIYWDKIRDAITSAK